MGISQSTALLVTVATVIVSLSAVVNGLSLDIRRRRRRMNPSMVAGAGPGADSIASSIGMDSSASPKHLVLVGGGHAHLQVMKALNRSSRPNHLQVTCVDMQSSALYSGMVPGCISKLYSSDETLLNLIHLSEWADIQFIHAQVTDIDLKRKLLTLQYQQQGPDSKTDTNADTDIGTDMGTDANHVRQISFDVISMDIGSSSRGLPQTPGTQQYTIPTRPIHDLVTLIESKEKELLQLQQQSESSPLPVHIVIIGGGAAGIELALSITGRWKPMFKKSNDSDFQVTLLNAGTELLPGETLACRDALNMLLQEKNIHVQHQSVVEAVQKHHICLANTGECVPYTACIWATGAAAHPIAFRLQKNHGLAVTDRGWIRVNQHLQSVSHPFLFAAGDCASIEGITRQDEVVPSPPKAGVYAVRSGPILVDNLTSVLKGEPPSVPYNPQDDFLKLLVCGDGTALGFRFGIPLRGKWVMQLKDTIDQSFMNLFRKERLPELESIQLDQGCGKQPYDTAQYDAITVVNNKDRPEQLESNEAANLLQRTDDGVDFMEAWQVLRDMAINDEYRQDVLAQIAHNK